ncbi:MAG TPA: PepSY domain-containing protein [Candidatus Blautia faecipullorum]|nr:PepSY domain-containing protein [Candidatus Blautia faecipullorum]
MTNKKMRILVGTMAAAAVLTLGQGSIAAAEEKGRVSEYLQKLQEEAEYTKEEALAITLEDAGIDEKDVKRSRVELDYDHGELTYDVEFYTESEEYDYEIDAKSGKILSADREIEKDFRSGDSGAEAEYTEEDALRIAREDAQLKEKDIDKSRVELEHDDGFLIYNVEFYVGNEEYDYEIDASTGRIMDVDYEIEDDFLDSGSEDVGISEAEAEKIALEMVPGASSDDLHMKLERDDGRLIYEGDIRYDGMEYEFEINAESGKIISWESESEWDD